MGLLDFLLHLLNFLAPALCVAGAVTLVARLPGIRGSSLRSGWPSLKLHWAVNSAVAVLALLAGLWVFGRDGKMASYTALVLAVASSQWGLLRSWR